MVPRTAKNYRYMTEKSLVIAPSIKAGHSTDGRVRLTEKFISGMSMTASQWHGPVELLIEPDEATHSGNLDDVWVGGGELPFRVTVAEFNSHQAKEVVSRAAVLQGGADHRLNHMAGWCAELDTKYVMVTEYSLRTRWQIIDADGLNPLIAWRRKAWAWRQERANEAAVRAAAAVQCNGTPTFDAYHRLNKNTLLYFDSRVTGDMLPVEPRLAKRTTPWSDADPLRLAFSGRLNKMKGADHLPKVALALRRLGVPFSLDIYGDGPLVPELHDTINREGLAGQVRLNGVLDFGSELMPVVRDAVDLFVCCHRQGDPSCTYLETFACGVPIVGYANEAFHGLLERCPAGASVPMDDVSALAATIQRLARDPSRVSDMARIGLEFARTHAFEDEFKQRIAQMKELAD